MKSNRKPVKRLERSFAFEGKGYTDADGHVMRYFKPEIRHGNIFDDGLDSEIHLGDVDLEKLGNPTRIKVTITKLD